MAAESNTTSAAIAESNNNNNNNSTTAAIAASNSKNNNNTTTTSAAITESNNITTAAIAELPTELLSHIGCFCTIGDITQSLTLVFKNQAFWALRICNLPESEKEYDFQALIRRCWQSAEEQKQRQYKLVISYLSRIDKLCCTLHELATFIQHTPKAQVTKIHVIVNMTRPIRLQVFEQWSSWRQIEEIHCLFTERRHSSLIADCIWGALVSQAKTLRALKLETEPSIRSFSIVPTQLLRTNTVKQIHLHTAIEPEELMTCLKHQPLEIFSFYDNQSLCQTLEEVLQTPSKQTLQSRIRELSVKRFFFQSWPSLMKLCRFPLLQKLSLSCAVQVGYYEVQDVIQPTMTQLLHLNELAVEFEYIEASASAAQIIMTALGKQDHRSDRFVLSVHTNDVMVACENAVDGLMSPEHEFYTLFYLRDSFPVGPLITRVLDGREFTLKISGNSHALKVNEITKYLQRWQIQDKVSLKYEAFHSTACSAPLWSQSCKTEKAEEYDRWVFEINATL